VQKAPQACLAQLVPALRVLLELPALRVHWERQGLPAQVLLVLRVWWEYLAQPAPRELLGLTVLQEQQE
jgi:hypothetical protein